jgi:lysophospholipase L1-like esterase
MTRHGIAAYLSALLVLFASPAWAADPPQSAINWACTTWRNYFPGGSCTLAYWTDLPAYMKNEALAAVGATPPPPAPPPAPASTLTLSTPPLLPPPTLILTSLLCSPLTGGASIVAVGDSITQGAGPAKPSYVDDLPIWNATVRYYNRGNGGDRTTHVLARMADILATGAPVALLMIGGNDVQNGDPLPTIMAALDLIVSQMQAVGMEPVLIGPTPRTAMLAPALRAYGVALATYAAAQGLLYIDPWSALANGDVMRADLTDDGRHPNARGKFLLARAIAHGLGWEFPGD